MNLNSDNILLIGSILLVISIIAGKTSSRFGVPVVILFVVVGMLAGSEGIGHINFSDPGIARLIGFVALNFILFSGGLDTKLDLIRPVFWHSFTLSTAGVLLTAVAVGVFVWAIADFTFYEGLLLGSIVSSTDAAAVFSVLKSRSIGLKKNLRETLELESGSNDPMTYFLTIAFTGLIINGNQSPLSLIPMFLKQMIIGAIAGYLSGRAGKVLINRIKLDFEGLYPVLVIGLMFLTWSFTNLIGGNGFLAIYISAIYLGNHHIIHKKTIMQVFDGIAWLMQIILFLALGLLVFPSHIFPVLGTGLLVAGFLMFVARPFSVFVSLLPYRMKLRNIAFISWVGLRGAVPIVFATYPLLAGVEKSGMIFNIVFFVSLSSVVVQGTTLPKMAEWLNVATPAKATPKTPSEVEIEGIPKSKLAEIELKDDCPAIGKKIVDIDFPESATIAIIKRDGQYIIPGGSTVIMPGDRLVILAETEGSLSLVKNCIMKISHEEEQEKPESSDYKI